VHGQVLFGLVSTKELVAAIDQPDARRIAAAG
jgi:hypothetical protein